MRTRRTGKVYPNILVAVQSQHCNADDRHASATGATDTKIALHVLSYTVYHTIE